MAPASLLYFTPFIMSIAPCQRIRANRARQITDATGNSVDARRGDLFYFPKGSVIRFRTEEEGGCLAFYCGQRGEGSA